MSAIKSIFFLRWYADLFDRRYDRTRSDTMFGIICHLDFSTPLCLFDRFDHRDRHFLSMRIHDHMTIHISSSTTDDLEEGSLRSEKSYFLCIEDTDK